MPELPEVETIRQQLFKKLKNKKIKKVEVKLARMVNLPAARFEKIVTGNKIQNIRRRAKLLILDLSSGFSILIHLKLTGQIIYNGKEGIGKPHIIYTFSDGHQLRHYDFRLFGYAKLIKTNEVEKLFEKEKFGPEPLSSKFTLEEFKKLLAKKPQPPIKPLLMDQTFLAGIGNVYAQEACFYAKIHPGRKVASLKEKEIKELYENLRKVLVHSLKYKGSSVDTYVDIYGQPGKFVSLLKVYGREGKPCFRCKAKIKTAKLGGRGTYFCPKCQK